MQDAHLAATRRPERETKTHQTATWRVEGRRDDWANELGAEGNLQGRQQEHGREATQRRPQDALRTLSASAGSQRRSLHVLDDQARGARVQETERAIARLLGTGGDQGQGTRPGIAAFTGLLQALSERGSTVGAASAAGVANLKQTWDDLEPEGAFDLVPHCNSNSSSSWNNIESTLVGHSDKQERIVFSVKLQAELWNSSDRTELKKKK